MSRNAKEFYLIVHGASTMLEGRPHEDIVAKGPGNLITRSFGGTRGGGSRGPVAIPDPDAPKNVEVQQLPTAVNGVYTGHVAQVYVDLDWCLYKEATEERLPFARAAPGILPPGKVQLVDLEDPTSALKIDEFVAFECTLTAQFMNTGLTFKSKPKPLWYDDELLQTSYQALMDNKKQYQCGAILLTDGQLKYLHGNNMLKKVLRFQDGGVTQHWHFNFDDTYWVYASYMGHEFLKSGTMWSWGGDDDHPTFQFQARVTSARVQARQEGSAAGEAAGKAAGEAAGEAAGYEVKVTSSTEVKAGGVSRSWTYAQNPCNRAMFPAVSEHDKVLTQCFILKFTVIVDDAETTCRAFDNVCSICAENSRHFQMSGCKHWVCRSCYQEILAHSNDSQDQYKCPYCRAVTDTADVVEIRDVPETQNAL